MLDQAFLKQLSETPSVGTACLPLLNLLTERFGAGYWKTYHSDGFCLFQTANSETNALEALFVAHVDEVGGCVYGARPEGGFLTRVWGNQPTVFAEAPLQAFDYLAEDASEAFPVQGEVVEMNNEARLVLHGDRIRPYRTVWTFQQEAAFEGDLMRGKALDPRATVYAVCEAVRALNTPRVGALFVMAEECAMDVAQKAVVYLLKNAPQLKLIVNADVPGIQNIGEGRLEAPAIRIFEGHNFIDPMFGIRAAEAMEAAGVTFHLSAARSGSQTRLFTPLAPTLSVALPSEGVHLPSVTMSLTGIARCATLLQALGAWALGGGR